MKIGYSLKEEKIGKSFNLNPQPERKLLVAYFLKFGKNLSRKELNEKTFFRCSFCMVTESNDMFAEFSRIPLKIFQ